MGESVRKGRDLHLYYRPRTFSPEWEPYVPYVLATIKLDEGVRMVATVVDCKPEDVKIGMKVQVVFNDATEQFTIPSSSRMCAKK